MRRVLHKMYRGGPQAQRQVLWGTPWPNGNAAVSGDVTLAEDVDVSSDRNPALTSESP